jgi:thioredoxin reductase/Pyruvate/2-oxoacid:ferredoxin oxidoreductase delta subunit
VLLAIFSDKMWNSETLRLSAYAAPMALIWGLYWSRRATLQRRSLRMLEAATQAGLNDPPSLHPVIDLIRCIGCGSCVTACPEGDILGVINGKSRLVNPSHCIGHGACKQACPTKAIELVFGTERRGVDIPVVSADFETNVPGIFIAGELGGMGLIQNAAEQGRQAIAAIRKLRGISQGSDLDVVIIGAGPAGFSASLAALECKLRFVTVEQETRGGTVAHYPRGKIVMTAPVKLPIVGTTRLRETTKEALLSFWEEIERRTGLRIQCNERVESVTAEGNGFRVRTSRGSYRTRAVLLAIGRRGTPRKLGMPGEDLSKVVYRLIDPAQYDGKHVLVVGGGDSALEAAAALAERPGTTVTLSYRGQAVARAREKNRDRLRAAEASGRLAVMLDSQVVRIDQTEVVIDQRGTTNTIRNDAVIVCAGGILPTHFLKEIGVHVETKYGTA